MKILILNWRSINDPLAGGAELMLFEHAKFWKKKGADILWFSSAYPGCLDTENIQGITFVHKGSIYTVYFLALWNFITGFFKKPDIVIDCFHGISFLTPVYARQIKIIALLHEVAGQVWFENSHPPVSIIGFILERFIFRFYKHIPFITVSQSSKSDLIRFGISPEVITIIHNGVTTYPIKSLLKKDPKPAILFLGRLSKDKGIKDALYAFDRIYKKNPSVQLWIAGKEEKNGQLKGMIDRISNKNTRENITYFGFVSDTEKFALYKKAWVLIHPSHKEGWGLTVIEAATQGTPTVGYHVEGLRDSIIDGKTGFLSKADPASLAEETLKLISNKKLYNNIAKQAKKNAKYFTWEKAGEESWTLIEKVYEK